MKTTRSLFFAMLALLIGASSAFALDANDIAKAQKILDVITKLTQKADASDVKIEAPAPQAGAEGKYVLPINADGSMTEWASKAFIAQVGSVAGEKAGETLASKVPMGGLLSGFAKKKGKEMGAAAAMGGMDYIKEHSTISFDNLKDYAVYLHSKLSSSGDYAQALAAAMALYPDLEKTMKPAINEAIELAKKASATVNNVVDEAKAQQAAEEATKTETK